MKLGEFLTVTVESLEALAADLLENEHLVCLGIVIEDGSLDNCTLYVRSTDLYCLSVLKKENLVELNCSTLVSLKAVDKDIHPSFYFELLACNVYDCVHVTKLIKSFRP